MSEILKLQKHLKKFKINEKKKTITNRRNKSTSSY